MKNLEEREIKQFSEFEEVTPESSQNLITDKGRFTVGALFQAVSDNFKNVASKGEIPFFAIKFSLVQNGEVIPDEYGYLVMEKSSDGSISPAYLSQAEFDEIYGGENE